MMTNVLCLCFAVLAVSASSVQERNGPLQNPTSFTVSGTGQFIKYAQPIANPPVFSSNLNTNTYVQIHKNEKGVATGQVVVNSASNGDNTGSERVNDWTIDVNCAIATRGQYYTDILFSGIAIDGSFDYNSYGGANGISQAKNTEAFGMMRFWDADHNAPGGARVERTDWYSEFETCMKDNGRSPQYGLLPISVLDNNNHFPYVNGNTDQAAFDNCASSYKFLVDDKAFPRCDEPGLYAKLAPTLNIMADNGSVKRIIDRGIPANTYSTGDRYDSTLKLQVSTRYNPGV